MGAGPQIPIDIVFMDNRVRFLIFFDHILVRFLIHDDVIGDHAVDRTPGNDHHRITADGGHEKDNNPHRQKQSCPLHR